MSISTFSLKFELPADTLADCFVNFHIYAVMSDDFERDATVPATIAQNEKTVREGFWPKLASGLSRIPFAAKAVAAYYCALDKDTPLRVKGILLAALAYFIMPLDAIPDVIAGLGFTDDLTVLLTAFGLIRSHIKPEHYARAEETINRLRKGDPVPDASDVS